MLLVDAAKIADVGLARFMNSDHVTQMSVMGTLAWAAPEVLRWEESNTKQIYQSS